MRWKPNDTAERGQSRSGWVPLLLLGVSLVAAAPASADFVHFRHLGDADPTGEGWVRGGFTNPSVTDGPTGGGAWFVDDASADPGSTGSFSGDPSPHLLAAQSGWRMLVRLRVEHDADTSPNASAFFEFSNGSRRYVMRFGTSQGQTTVRPDGASLLVVGAAGAFHTVELVSLDGESVEIFVDGSSRLTGYPGTAAGGVVPRVVWGSADSGQTARGEYARVEWATAHLQLASGLDGNTSPDVDGSWVVWTQRPDVLVLRADRPRSAGNPIVVASNAVGSTEARIDWPWVVWHGFGQGNLEIFAYDLRLPASGSNPFPLSDDTASDLDPEIDGSFVVWERGFDDVYAYDLSQGPPGAEFPLSSGASNRAPQVSGTWAVWEQALDVIWAYDLTQGAGGTPIPLTLADSQLDEDPRIDDERVVWEGVRGGIRDLFLYDLGAPSSGSPIQIPIRLTDTPASEQNAQIDANWVVWEADSEIFALDLDREPSPDNPRRLTDNGLIDFDVRVSRGQAVWVGGVANVNTEIYTVDLGAVPAQGPTPLTDSDFFDLTPRIDRPRVVYEGLEAGNVGDPSDDLDAAFLAPEPGLPSLAVATLATVGLLARRCGRSPGSRRRGSVLAQGRPRRLPFATS